MLPRDGFEVLIGHAAHLAARIDIATAQGIGNLDIDEGMPREWSSYQCILSLDGVLAKQNGIVPHFWQIAQRYALTPPDGSVREVESLYQALPDADQSALVNLVTNALLKWRHFMLLSDLLVGIDEGPIIAAGSSANDKLIALQCLVTGANPEDVEAQIAGMAELWIAHDSDVGCLPDISDTSACPENLIERQFEVLKQHQFVAIDLAAADANPHRGGFERKLSRLVEVTAASNHPDRVRALWKGLLIEAARRFPWKPPHSPARPISVKPLEESVLRRATRVIAMVHELHKAGYQSIRISPGMSPSGCYWRCNITYAANVEHDGYSIREFDPEDGRVARYTSGQGANYFEWADGQQLNAREMADRFLRAFPLIAARGDGRDWTYAGWLTDVLGRAEQGTLVALYADYPIDEEELRLWLPPPVSINSERPSVRRA